MEKNYLQDLKEIRSMMEKSAKFFSISGLSGVLAGVYSLLGAYLVYAKYQFNPQQLQGSHAEGMWQPEILYVAIGVLLAALITAWYLSYKNAQARQQSIWNTASKAMLLQMGVPLVIGGLLCLAAITQQWYGLLPGLTLLFYGLALFGASTFTYKAIRLLGLILILLGLWAIWQISMGMLLWSLGFGVAHIMVGLYLHFKA